LDGLDRILDLLDGVVGMSTENFCKDAHNSIPSERKFFRLAEYNSLHCTKKSVNLQGISTEKIKKTCQGDARYEKTDKYRPFSPT
ncbi:MAG: hypothetical protein J6Z79_06635, partial [Clostridia bacterium]|nr:hypothetical protein [Clostridia bacterium]